MKKVLLILIIGLFFSCDTVTGDMELFDEVALERPLGPPETCWICPGDAPWPAPPAPPCVPCN